MSLELFPQNIQLFPDDRQLFTARATNLEPMWTNVRAIGLPTTFPNGVVDADYSVRKTFGSGQLAADGALELAGGVGAVEFTLTVNCLPSSTSSSGLTWKFFFDGTTPQAHDYILEFFSNRVEISAASSVIATITRTLVVGDVFRVELSNAFRLFINGALIHERLTFSSSIQYPATYSAIVTASIIGNVPTIPAPRLSGSWRLRPVVDFTAPAEGSITTAGPALETEYFDGEIPGVYKLLGQILPGVEAWWEDAAPTGSSVSTSGGTWTLTGLSDTPAPISGIGALKSPSPAGEALYLFQNATDTLQINKDDVLVCYVFIDAGDPTTEIMLVWIATDATGPNHRAYWGANSLTHGVDGTPSRRFMGALPPTNQWVRLEVQARLVDMEGRTANGGGFLTFDGICSFDQFGRLPGKIQRAESVITIPGLQVLGESPRTMQPSAEARIQANYDDAQTPGVVTWSIVSGRGSLSGNKFTASAGPGATIVRASGPGNQISDLRVNVPALITPNFGFAGPLEQLDWDTNIAFKPSFVSVGTVASGTGGVTPGLPPALREGDLMLLPAKTANEAVSTPSGWGVVTGSPQSIGTGGVAGSVRLSLFWKRATAGDVLAAMAGAGVTIADPGDHVIAQILNYGDCIITGNPWDVTEGDTAASSSSVSIPGDTTTVPNTLIVQFVAHATDTASPQVSTYVNTDLTNLTERTDVSTTSNLGGGFAVIDGEKATAGAFGATTATLATPSAQARITIALKPNVTVWSSVPSGINSSTGVWTLPNEVGKKVRISVTDGVFTAERDVLILPKFPIGRFATPMEGERRKKVLISEAEDGTEVTRVKNKDGKARDYYSVQIKNLIKTEFESIQTFYDDHHPAKPFIFEDVPRGIRMMAKFDSDFAWRGGPGRFDIAFRVKQVAL